MHGEYFQTNGPGARAAAFYRAKGLQLLRGETAERVMFQKGRVDEAIQNPWMDMKTGALKKSILISSVRGGHWKPRELP